MPPQRSIRSFFTPATRSTSQSSQHTIPVSQPTAPSTHPQQERTLVPPSPSHSPTPERDPVSSHKRSQSPPATSKPAPAPAPSTNVSHTATESLPSRPPHSSGNSTNTSKRVFSDGQPVVLNSDSDSDTLSDLDEILLGPSFKPKASTMVPLKGSKNGTLRKPPKRQRDDGAFKRLVQAAHKNAETDRHIAEVQETLDKPTEDNPESNLQINEDLIANTVHDDEDPEKAKRLYAAMQRTNALHVDCVFHLFGQGLDNRKRKNVSFPIKSFPQHAWTSSFEDLGSREQAFMSGFAQQIFQFQQLPEELASWMIDEVCHGTSEALIPKYTEILSVHDHHLKTLVDKERLDTLFERLGADKNCLSSSQEVVPSLEISPDRNFSTPRSLVHVCKFLQVASPRLRSAARSHALYILAHVCMDDNVQSDIGVTQVLQDTIESLLLPISSNSELVSILDEFFASLLSRIKHPILQRNLVCALPSMSPFTAYLQRLLALSFLIHPTRVTTPLNSPEILDCIRTHLDTSPSFRITKKSDYASLAARFTLLDIAIGPGPLTVPYQPLISPPASQSFDDAGSASLLATAPTSQEERDFNKQVDALAHQIRTVGNAIDVAGAMTDLSRLAASNACDLLCTRLENAVRIGGRKMKKVFGKEEEHGDGERVRFKNWFGVRAEAGSG